MDINKFKTLFGSEEQKVTLNFATKALGGNYNLSDAIVEFCDNSCDARIGNEKLNFVITVDNKNHTLSFTDDGKGIVNAENLFKLGGTDKEERTDAIGKYGIGVEGAMAKIASHCMFDKNEIVVINFSSSHKGKHIEKCTCFENNGNQTIGQTKISKCDKNEHFTHIEFTNVKIKNGDCVDICSALEATFEESLQKYLNITMIVDGDERKLGQCITKTFVGDELAETIKVGKLSVDVKYRIIGGANKSEHKFADSGLRFYDKNSGRLLGNDTKYWHWFTDINAQQKICGLRVGIYIDGSLDSYKKFGVYTAKNGIKYAHYYKDQDFSELKQYLKNIHSKAASKPCAEEDKEIVFNGYRYMFTESKTMSEPYSVVDNGVKMVIVKKKANKNDIIKLIDENIMLKKQLEKKNKKSKA